MSDLIDRQAAIDAVLKISEDETAVHNGWVDPYYVMEMLKRLPSAQPDRKKGKWETAYLPHEYMGCRPTAYYCSECNHIATFRTFYCPNCGADMRGDNDE